MPVKIVVLGGAVIDHVFRVAGLPQWGRGIHAESFDRLPGGKGLNQAVAAARLGAEVTLISAVGQDYYGQIIIETLTQHEISHEFVETISDASTAVAEVFVNPQSEAAFVVWNQVLRSSVSKNLVRRAKDKIMSANVILITFEIPHRALREAIDVARAQNTLVFLNPSPPLDLPRKLFHDLLTNTHILIPNQWEAAKLLQMEGDAATLAQELRGMGAETVCVTMAEKGCVLATKGEVWEYPAYPTRVVDTTGAGDAFCAALAVSLAEGNPMTRAVDYANAAGALAVSKVGATPAMPDAGTLEEFLKQNSRVSPSRLR